jgi:hypothetical protein
MEVGLGREAEVTVTKAMDGDGRHDGVERRAATDPMNDDRAWRRGAHDR